jgi:C-terminal processing protease CtpA/Prc
MTTNHALRPLASAILSTLVLSATALTAALPVGGQSPISFDRSRGTAMLRSIKSDIQKHYYDPAFHGVDIEARFKAAEEKIQTATSTGQIFAIIAQALIDLHDSHTFFLPPSRTNRVEYGWVMHMVGDKCYVVAVKPGSDAESKGLKPGDEVLTIGGYPTARDVLWEIKYLFYTLRPAPGMRVVLRKGGQQQQIDVMASVKQGKRVYDLTGTDGGNDIWNLIRESESEGRLRRHRTVELDDNVLIWKMPEFDLTEDKVDEMIDKARKRKALILDLRGNPGGLVLTLKRLVGDLFDHDVKIADLKGRKEFKPMVGKSRGDRGFQGKLVVLVDSESGSAAEILARVVQLEKRGIVMGDRSAGGVMQSESYEHQLGADTVIFYAASITNADVIMTDGKSLENVGVIPDELVLPSSTDLLNGRDPVLARAAALVDAKLDPEKAGALFPIEWRK